MKKPFPKMILRILLVCVLLLGFLYMDDDIGTSAANLESDIRNLQKIPEDWIVEGDVSDTMAAYISYPQDRSDHTFSVYVNRPDFPSDISFAAAEVFPELKGESRNSRSMGITSGPSSL